MSDNSRKEIKVDAYKDQTWDSLTVRGYRNSVIWKISLQSGWVTIKRFYLSRKSRDLHRIDICSYTVGQDSIVPVIKERMNTYQETRPLHL